MPAANSPKKKSGVCSKCKQRFSFELKPELTSVECPHCQAKINLKPKADKKPSPTAKASRSNAPSASHGVAPAKISSPAESPSKLDFVDAPSNPVDPPSENDLGPEIESAQTPTIVVRSDKVPKTPVANPSFTTEQTITQAAAGEDHSDDSPPHLPRSPRNSLPAPKPSLPPSDQPDDSQDKALKQLTQMPQLVPEVDLLPPKFIVDQAAENVVVLPAADGGTQIVDPNVVHVKHGDRTISLTTLTPIQKARRQAIQNFVILLLAALMLVAAIWILL